MEDVGFPKATGIYANECRSKNFDNETRFWIKIPQNGYIKEKNHHRRDSRKYIEKDHSKIWKNKGR
jgi:hypothetical protein